MTLEKKYNEKVQIPKKVVIFRGNKVFTIGRVKRELIVVRECHFTVSNPYRINMNKKNFNAIYFPQNRGYALLHGGRIRQ
jgi:hypothetical protein